LSAAFSNGVKLTNAVYGILAYLPESDPLKNRAKDKALSVMERLNSVFGTTGWASLQKEKDQEQLLNDIDILLGYLNIGSVFKTINFEKTRVLFGNLNRHR